MTFNRGFSIWWEVNCNFYVLVRTNCVSMRSQDGDWMDQDCTSYRSYVCKKKCKLILSNFLSAKKPRHSLSCSFEGFCPKITYILPFF